jgi:membrane protein YqaA with SNARE-associated domain
MTFHTIQKTMTTSLLFSPSLNSHSKTILAGRPFLSILLQMAQSHEHDTTSKLSLSEQARQTKNPIKKLYFWTLHWSGTRFALPALGLVSFAESSFFPIPPDVLLMAMCFSNRKRWFLYALVCTVASVLGGIAGWYIGFALYESVGQSIIDAFHYQEAFDTVGRFYEQNAFLSILGAGFTPIPYKVFTIAAGVFHDQVHLGTLIIASSIGRGARFFLVAIVIRIFGEPARHFLERNFGWASLGLFLLALLGVIAIKLL